VRNTLKEFEREYVRAQERGEIPPNADIEKILATMAASTFATLGTSALAPYLRTSLHLSTFEVGLIPGLVFLGALAASVRPRRRR